MEKRALRNRKVSERMAVVDEADRRRVRAAAVAACPPPVPIASSLCSRRSHFARPLAAVLPSLNLAGHPGAAGGAGGRQPPRR